MGIFKHIETKKVQREVAMCLIASLALASLTGVCFVLHLNLATALLLYVVVVVVVSSTGSFVSSIVAAIAAALCLAYLAPPAHSFRVDDPFDVVAIAAFFVISTIIARLVSRVRRMAEGALSSVDRRLVDAEERERARIARDLHDDVGQRIALFIIKFGRFRAEIPNPTVEVQTTMDDLLKQINQLSSDIQALARSLHSPKLEYLGLVKTMRSFCEEFGQRQDVEIDFNGHGHEVASSLPPDISLSLYRVLQEALHNSRKHSGARQVEVDLFETSGAIHLTVRDSGHGFNIDAAMSGRGLGLISMRERIKLVKGEFSIHSQPNRGTTIHASVPLPSQGNATRTQRIEMLQSSVGLKSR